MIRYLLTLACFALISANSGLADGPDDNAAITVRPIPPAGIEIPNDVRASLEHDLAELTEAITSTRIALATKPDLLAYMPDVEVFHKAVAWALQYGEFYKENEFKRAKELIEAGLVRADQLAQGLTPWTRETGLVVRGYRSRIDDSVQPYGLVIPAAYDFDAQNAWRLDFWFHGRGETLTELDFVAQRMHQTGEFAPANAIVLHPYGRYCNANKFAGESDLFEALEAAQRDYRIDEDRLLVRGFSMGGASCWQFATHYADRWAGAAPGAGFSETADFLRTFQKETLNPAWYEERLWHWYNATDWAVNLAQCPTVAYSGEIDRQKQAADMMAASLKKEGIELVHLIGPNTAHKYHPDVKPLIDARMDALAAKGRQRVPRQIHFTTFTLRYPSMHWVHLERLTKHWEPARVEATLNDSTGIRLTTRGVEALTLRFGTGDYPLDPTHPPMVSVNDQALEALPGIASDFSWECTIMQNDGHWSVGTLTNTLAKRPNLQGPIDDVFMDRFLMVTPTGEAWNSATAAWTKSELAHALSHWRSHFRGDALAKKDIDVTDEDIRTHHLVLWGDPQSNQLLKRIIGRLPLQWSQDSVKLGTDSFDAAMHTVAMVYPNPLNPDRYVALNTGFTFREYDYLNNARQTPKLPDYAIIDVTQPTNSRFPGGLPLAGFFGESWEVLPDQGK